jgi:4-amino-4-deoxy-L-arabinose transferase-like glycosyltransferase
MQKRVFKFLPLLLIFALYLGFSGYRLRWLPAEWYGDISIEHREVTTILSHNLSWRFNESAGPAYHYVVAAFARVLGQSFETYKIASLVTGLAVVWLVYLFGKELVGRRVGLLAALVAALSTWLIIFARLGSSPQILTPLLSAGAVYFLLRFARNRNWLELLVSMCFAGLGLFTYPATFILPVVIVALIGWQIVFTRPRGEWWQALLLALVVMVPFTLWFIRLAESTPAFAQGGYVGSKLLGHGLALELTVKLFVKNMLTALGMFQFTGDRAFRTNVSDTPVLDTLSGILMDLGLIWLFLNPRLRPRWAYLIAPIVILLLPSVDPALPSIEIPSASRAFAAAPFVFVLIALGLDAAWIFASRLITSRETFLQEAGRRLEAATARAQLSNLQSWVAALDEAGPLAARCRRTYLITGLVLVSLAAGMASLNLNRYFGAYAWGLPEHNQPWGLQIARLIDAQPASTVVKLGACCWGDWKDPDPESVFYVLQHPQGREYLLKDAYVNQCAQLAAGKDYLLIFPPEPDSPLVNRFTSCFPTAYGQMHYDALGQKAFYSLYLSVPY